MSLRTLLRILLHRLAAMIRAVRHWDPRARLRFLLSILRKHVSDRPKSHPAAIVPDERLSSVANTGDVCCSEIPASAVASLTSLHVPGNTIGSLNLRSSESRASSRAPSIRSAHSYQSAYGDEERRIRAQAITKEQREELIVTRQESRVAVMPSRSRSHSRAPSAREARSNLPTPTHSELSLSRHSTRDANRPATPSGVHPHRGRRPFPNAGYNASRPGTPESSRTRPTHSSPTSPPTPEITTIDIQPPSPTSPSSSQRLGTTLDNSLLYPDISVASSQTVCDDLPDGFLRIPDTPSDRILREITPDGLPRYERRATTARKTPSHEVQPLTVAFPHVVPASKVPVDSLGDWKAFTHAEGSLYFHHPEKRIWTNAYMYEEIYHQEVEDCAAFLKVCQQDLLEGGHPFPIDYELVIEIKPESNNVLLWQYYYVDHTTRSIFWLQTLVLWKELDSVNGELSPDHIYHRIQQFYWHHVFHFPAGRQDVSAHFGKAVWSELLSFMDFNALDTILSPRSTSFYSDMELMHMKKMVKFAYDQSRENALLPDQLSAVARIQMVMAEQRFLHAHGQPYVRLKNNDSIHPDEDGRKAKSWLFYIMGILLFRAPFTLLQDLHNVNVDGMIQEYAWRKYFKRLLDDWDRLVLQGTVILTANVSFLAIPDVIHFPAQPSGTGGDSAIQPWVQPQFTWSGLLSYISTLAALGSVMAGLLLARLNRAQIEHHTDAAIACDYLRRHTSLIFDLEPIAVIYSLPYALLLWGTGFFLAALLSFTFDSTDTATRSVVGVGALIVTGLLLWSILSGKLMLLDKLWLPLKDSCAYDELSDFVTNTTKFVSDSRRAAIAKMKTMTARLRSTMISTKRANDETFEASA